MDDPASSSTFVYVLLPLLLGMSALFSASETSLFRLSEAHLQRLSALADPRATRLVALRQSPQATLSMLLLCNTTVNVGFATVLTSVMLLRQPTLSTLRLEVLVTAAATVLILFWGEILPKTIASRTPLSLALKLASLIWWLGRLLRPVTSLLESTALRTSAAVIGHQEAGEPFKVTADTVEMAVGLGTEQGVIEPAESEMIRGALEATATTVREIMTPRTDLVRLSVTATVGEAAEAIVSSGFSRIPIYQHTVDNVVGVVYVKDVLTPLAQGLTQEQVSAFARRPYFVPEMKSVSDLLREMRTLGEVVAIVVDEYGGTAGIVTLEDIIEEIVGEIADEFDRPEDRSLPIDGGHLCSGRLLIDDANYMHSWSLPVPDDVDSLGGLIYWLAGRPPQLGETFSVPGYRLTVADVRGNRVLRVKIETDQPDVKEVYHN